MTEGAPPVLFFITWYGKSHQPLNNGMKLEEARRKLAAFPPDMRLQRLRRELRVLDDRGIVGHIQDVCGGEEGAIVIIVKYGTFEIEVHYPQQYPWKGLVYFMRAPFLPHPGVVLQALRTLPAEPAHLITLFLQDFRTDPLKKFVYESHRKMGGDGVAALEEYTRTMSPYLWSPAMQLADQWPPLTHALDLLTRATTSCHPSSSTDSAYMVSSNSST